MHAIIPITIALYGEQLQRLAVRLRLPLVVPEARRTQMAEVVVRVNDGLDLGRFDLDLSMGRLSCLATMPIADGDVTKEQFDALLVGAMVTTDPVLPGLRPAALRRRSVACGGCRGSGDGQVTGARPRPAGRGACAALEFGTEAGLRCTETWRPTVKHKVKDYWEKRTERFCEGPAAQERAGRLRMHEHVTHVKVHQENREYVVSYSVAKWYLEELTKAKGKL